MNAAGSGLSGIARSKSWERAFAIAPGLAALVVGAAAFLAIGVGPAEALPSYARQTGQPCAACHTAFPELTPFGRRFKLSGYTLDGGDSFLPFSGLVEPAFTHNDEPANAA